MSLHFEASIWLRPFMLGFYFNLLPICRSTVLLVTAHCWLSITTVMQTPNEFSVSVMFCYTVSFILKVGSTTSNRAKIEQMWSVSSLWYFIIIYIRDCVHILIRCVKAVFFVWCIGGKLLIEKTNCHHISELINLGTKQDGHIKESLTPTVWLRQAAEIIMCSQHVNAICGSQLLICE